MLDEHMGPIKKYSILTVGAVVLALANYVFKFPNHFSFGGVAGFAVILSGMFGGSASTYTFVINMLLLLIAFPILGKEVAMRSFYVSIVFSGVLEVAQYVYPIDKPITNQPVLELVFSFMLLAVCSAIFFFMDASSGGTDIIALILKKYAYTEADTVTGTAKTTETYTYGNSAWKDQLTEYRGQKIRYDAMGNPISYRGMTMEWEQGRKLKKITGNGVTQSHSYDADGIRIRKVVNGVTTQFYTNGTSILAQKSSDGTRLDFLYDDQGKLFAMEYEGERYF